MKAVTMNTSFENLRHYVVIAGVGIALWALVTQTDGNFRTFTGSLEGTRPIAQLATFILGCISLWAIGSAIHHYRQYNFRIAWLASFKTIGWIPVVLSTMAVIGAIVLNLSSDDMPWFRDNRAIESIIPLAIGMVSATLFSPDDDATIETQLTLARPIAWVLLERLTVLIISQFIIGLIAVGITLLKTPDSDFVITLIRWIPSSILLASVGTYVTFKSRNMALGIVVVGFIWALFLIFEPLFIPGTPTFFPLNHIQPYIWAFNPYLQPESLPLDAYWLNRLGVTFLGISLFALTIHQLNDEEYVLLGTKSR